MSAQTSYEPRTVEQAACYVDWRGYVICTGCYHAGVDHAYERSRDTYDNCDRCHALLSQSIELVDGWAVIEYPLCKIF